MEDTSATRSWGSSLAQKAAGRLVGALVSTGLLAGCHAPSEQALLAERLDAAHAASAREPPAPGPARRDAITALRAVDLHDPGHREARDICAELYESMLEHEEAYRAVTALLDAYEATPREQWPADVTARLHTGYAASQAATERIGSARARCEEARGALRRERITEGR